MITGSKIIRPDMMGPRGPGGVIEQAANNTAAPRKSHGLGDWVETRGSSDRLLARPANGGMAEALAHAPLWLPRVLSPKGQMEHLAAQCEALGRRLADGLHARCNGPAAPLPDADRPDILSRPVRCSERLDSQTFWNSPQTSLEITATPR
jgi:hypothetical protein